jgi:hypothetical protein
MLRLSRVGRDGDRGATARDLGGAAFALSVDMAAPDGHGTL